MILVDTGPLVALANSKDQHHGDCLEVLFSLQEPLLTTIPVLTEALYLLSPGSIKAASLMDFVSDPVTQIWFMNETALRRCFELMHRYSDCPMELADASVVACAEQKGLSRVFTLDRKHFTTYRIKHGHRHVPFEITP